jgi:hypothetical protein
MFWLENLNAKLLKNFKSPISKQKLFDYICNSKMFFGLNDSGKSDFLFWITVEPWLALVGLKDNGYSCI